MGVSTTGVIGDVLKGIIGVTGLGVVKPKRLRKGKGVLTNIIKAVAPSAIADKSTRGQGKHSFEANLDFAYIIPLFQF